MIPNYTIKPALLTAALATILSGTTHASVTTWELGNRMTSASGNVVIGEFTNNFSPGLVGYEVDLASSTQIHLFAVSHGESNPGSIAAPSGWTFTNVAKADWAGGSYGYNSSISGASLGSFESLFGSMDTHVIIFKAPDDVIMVPGSTTYIPGPGGFLIPVPGTPTLQSRAGNLSDGNSNTIHSDSNEANWSASDFTPRFTRDGSPASEFIAVDSSGSIIAQSIPEPSSALLGSLAALTILRRRR